MIASLTGTLTKKNPTEILIEVHGVGYAVHIPLSTFEKLGNVGSSISLLIYLHIREDAVQLFGFSTEEERWLFKLLISVSGVGPKIAQGILSGMAIGELKSHLRSGDVLALTTIPGIGKKTAERLILELRDKIAEASTKFDMPTTSSITTDQIRNEALQALISLGYNQQIAEKSIRLVLKELTGADISVEELIKRALRHTNVR